VAGELEVAAKDGWQLEQHPKADADDPAAMHGPRWLEAGWRDPPIRLPIAEPCRNTVSS